MRTSTQKVIVALLIGGTLAAGFGSTYFQYFLSRHADTVLHPESGAVYAVIVFHRQVFLSEAQNLALMSSWALPLLIAAVAYFFNQRWRCYVRRY